MDELPLFPVTATEAGTIREHGVLILRLPFLAHALQDPDHATLDRTYVLMPSQARQLVQQITSRLALLESAPPTSAPGSEPQH